MKRILTIVAAVLLGGVLRAGAVMIEGVDPTGNLRTVGVDSSGKFEVASGSSNVQHVIIDGGTTTVKTDPLAPLAVNVVGGSIAISSAVPVSVVIDTSATGCSVIVANGGILNGTAAIYPADPARKQGVVCNTADYSAGVPEIRIGAASGPKLLPYGCYSPDGPGSFTGAIVGISTMAVSYGYVYCK